MTALPTDLDPATDSTRDKLEGIQALRAAAACLVVLLHVEVTEVKFGNPGSRIFDGFLAGHAGVDIFFVISGFVMVITSVSRAGSLEEARRFLGKRIARIYPVYWFYCLLVLGTWLIMPQWVNSSTAGDPNLLASFLLYPADGAPLLMVAWTLELEIFFYLLFAGFMLLPRRFLLPGLLASLAALTTVGVFVGTTSDLEKVVFSPMLLEFAGGCLVGIFWKSSSRPWYSVATITGTVGLVLSSVGLDRTVVSGIGETNFVRPLTYGVAGMLLVFGLSGLERTGRLRYPRFVLALGDASYTLYLSHLLVLSAVGRLWRALGADGLSNALFVFVLLGFTTAGARRVSLHRAPADRHRTSYRDSADPVPAYLYLRASIGPLVA